MKMMFENDDYIPFSGSTFGLIGNSENKESLIKIQDPSIFTDIEERKIFIPSVLNDLPYESTETLKLSIDAALNLGIPIGHIQDKIGRSIFLQEYRKFNVITKGSEEVYFGICIRWIVNIKKLESSADISSLPMVVASGQFNYVSASAKFEILGISSPKITELMPAPTDLNTESYVELTKAFNEIKKLIWEHDTKITPSIIGIKGRLQNDQNSTIEKSVPVVHALKMISRRKILGRALNKINDGSARDIITSVYLEIVKSSELNFKIDIKSKEEAKRLLKFL